MNRIGKNLKFLIQIIKSIYVRVLSYLLPKDCYIQELPGRLFDHENNLFKRSYRRNDKLISWTISDPNRSAMFYLLLDSIKEIKGNYAELGTHRGHTARIIFEQKEEEEELYIFDTFEGFDEKDVSYEKQIGVEAKSGHFSNTSISVVNKEITGMVEGSKSLITRKGYFPETFLGLEDTRWKFVHLDADLYKPMKAGLKLFYPRLIKGGMLLIHDYGGEYEGTRKAVNEFKEENDIVFIPMYDKVGSALIIKYK